MTLRFGREHLAIPGPSVMPDRVLRAMHRPAPNIYEGELVDLTASVIADLKSIAGDAAAVAIYIGNGHAVWEASLCNAIGRGDSVLALITGRFGLGWAAMARALGIDVESLDFGSREAVDPAAVAERLQADTSHRIRAVLTVQTDTATGVCNDIVAIRQAMDEVGHPALLMVDSIASFACEPMNMRDWGVDVLVTACQKGLMTPPGLGFVFLGERALEVSASESMRTPYWDWRPRIEPSLYYEHFCGTAPTHHLYGLREALDMLLEEGMPAVWRRHRTLATAIWAAIDVWSEAGHLSLNVPRAEQRSAAVTSINTAPGVADTLRSWCEREAGLTLGVGFNPAPEGGPVDDIFRIGHMGHLNPPMVLGTLATIETALQAIGIEHGKGAIDAAAAVLAGMIEPTG